MTTVAPTLAGYQNFISNVMGIDGQNLPPEQPVIGLSFQAAIDTVNLTINCAAPGMYTAAVYNLAADFLLNWAPDVPGQNYFENIRKKWKLDNWAAGVVASTTDASTSTALEVIEAAKNFTIGDLQNLRTPYGRTYLSIAQKYGPTIWGLS